MSPYGECMCAAVGKHLSPACIMQGYGGDKMFRLLRIEAFA